MNAAAELFVARGIASVQAQDIAERAGVSVGAFYRYFDDKQSVLVEWIHRVLERNRVAQAAYLKHWRGRLERGETQPRAFLEDMVKMAAAQQAAPAELLRAFVALSYTDEKVAALRRAYDEHERRELARFIGALTSRERIPSPLAAARLLDLCAEEVLRWAAIEGGRPARETRAALVEMLYRYLFADAR